MHHAGALIDRWHQESVPLSHTQKQLCKNVPVRRGFDFKDKLGRSKKKKKQTNKLFLDSATG